MRTAQLIVIALVAGLVPATALAQTPTAVIVPNGYTQFSDANGKPISDGTVRFYVPGTTTPKTTWQDPYQTIVNPNPIVLNGSGAALIWGSGIYREVVYDVNGNLIWDQLTGGYNCVGGGVIPGGANGALQYNNNGILGGLSLGTNAQVLLGNATGPPTWGTVPLGALPGGVTGTGPFVLENNPVINNPTINGGVLNSPVIHNPTIDGGTWNNPTFTGTITGLPGGSSCQHRGGTPTTYCVGSDDILEMELVVGTPPTGGSINGHTASSTFAWNVYDVPGLLVANQTMARVTSEADQVPKLQDQVRQLATAAGVHLQ